MEITAVPSKIKHTTTIQLSHLLLGIYSRETKTCVYKTSTELFTAALFLTVKKKKKNGNNPKIHQLTNTENVVYQTTEHYTATERNETRLMQEGRKA